MDPTRYLIVNADDLGLCAAVNAGIVAAHQQGIVTSASLMVRQTAAPEAVEAVAALPRLAIGLHLDLGQWDYAAGQWLPAYRRCDEGDPVAVERECRDQLRLFHELVGRPPTHVDSHQHVHNSEPVASSAARIASELGVPLRGRRIRYEGGFYGQSGKGEPFPEGISSSHLIALIGSLPAGWTELGCHPGTGMHGESSYSAEREVELRALCDPAVRAALAAEGVALRSFADAPGAG